MNPYELQIYARFVIAERRRNAERARLARMAAARVREVRRKRRSSPARGVNRSPEGSRTWVAVLGRIASRLAKPARPVVGRGGPA